MSTCVSFMVVRKSDYCPVGIYYLGDEKLKQAIAHQRDYEFSCTLQVGRTIYSFVNARQATGFLSNIYSGDFFMPGYESWPDAAAPLYFIDRLESPDDLAYFVMVE